MEFDISGGGAYLKFGSEGRGLIERGAITIPKTLMFTNLFKIR